ncbi:hypothetical protein EMCG_08566 [[Emmonsia] crescens]|uniref:Uncharacterized protein n=1 Tax=[Emmonsia] crescens TaxID=73230 RepID=A0A0G2I4Q2_9EURO|nr:hypothetical protein EMCG_08566 [Emmonsia crescens UAMH 3008]
MARQETLAVKRFLIGVKADPNPNTNSVMSHLVPVLSHSASFPAPEMLSADDFFELVAQKKDVLEANPFLDVGDQNGLEVCYCLLNNIDKPASGQPRQTLSRHSKAQQSLRNAHSIAKSLFVIVAVTISITDLASIEHSELFPRLEHWWRSNPPSEEFDLKAQGLLQELNVERERGNIPRVRGNWNIRTAHLQIMDAKIIIRKTDTDSRKSQEGPKLEKTDSAPNGQKPGVN